MRKIIDGLALFAGVVSLAIVGTGGYAYLQREAIKENVKSRVTGAITELLSDALPVAIDAEVPKIPKATGPAIPTLPGK